MVAVGYPVDAFQDDDQFALPTIGGAIAVRHATFDYTDITAKTLFTLPAGAIPLDWIIDVTTDFDAGTNNDIDFGAGADVDYFAADLAIGTQAVYRLGDTNYVAGRVGVQFVVDTAITVIYKPTGTTVTAGVARVIMPYMMGGN